jgi:hypothetical protein
MENDRKFIICRVQKALWSQAPYCTPGLHNSHVTYRREGCLWLTIPRPSSRDHDRMWQGRVYPPNWRASGSPLQTIPSWASHWGRAYRGCYGERGQSLHLKEVSHTWIARWQHWGKVQVWLIRAKYRTVKVSRSEESAKYLLFSMSSILMSRRFSNYDEAPIFSLVPHWRRLSG